jgi:predicted Rossmann fold nucleotide-binding protein DprA/Smf involved in DNA uptake
LSIDDLCRRTEQPIAALSVVLTMLEMDGRVRKLPGNIYERV